MLSLQPCANLNYPHSFTGSKPRAKVRTFDGGQPFVGLIGSGARYPSSRITSPAPRISTASATYSVLIAARTSFIRPEAFRYETGEFQPVQRNASAAIFISRVKGFTDDDGQQCQSPSSRSSGIWRSASCSATVYL